MTMLHAFLLGIVEGLTEFLPISSTGHMVLVSSFLGIAEDEFTKAFEVIIQMGAILTVLALYWRRFLGGGFDFYRKIIVAFIPTAILGFILKKQVDVWLESTAIVAWALILGGIVLIVVERFKPGHEGRTMSDLKDFDNVSLGFFQSIAMIPGVSRSGATIVGGLLLGMKKSEAAEFSFFLAVPTMAAATAYKVFKMYQGGAHFDSNQMQMLAVGFVTAFFVAGLAIKGFMGFIKNRSFAPFGWYRIAMGILILILLSQKTGPSL